MDLPGSINEKKSLQNIFVCWENKKLITDIGDGQDMDFETHIQQFATEAETVTWNVEKKNDWSIINTFYFRFYCSVLLSCYV